MKPYFFSRPIILLCLTIGVSPLLSARAGSEVYLSNFYNPDGVGFFMSESSPEPGQRFRTGSDPDGYILDSVKLRVGHSGTTNVQNMIVTVRSDTANAPGSVVATLSGPSPTNNFLTNMVYTAPAGTVLQGNTRYWITIGSANAENRYFWRFIATNYTEFTGKTGWAMVTNGSYNLVSNSEKVFFTEIKVRRGVNYFQNFESPAVGATSMGDGSTLFSTSPGTVAGVQDAAFKSLQLSISNIPNTRSAFLLPDLDPGTSINAFSAKWTAQLKGNYPNAGEGFSVSFGPLANLDLKSVSYNQEEGYGVGITFSVETAENSSGYYLRVNGKTNAFTSFVSSNQWGVASTNFHLFELDWHYLNGASVKVNGQTVFSNVPTYGYIPNAGDRLVWAARTSGFFAEEIRLDNILVVTGGNLVKETVSSPYVSTPGSMNQASAFDNDPLSMWSAFDPNGFIGGTLSTQRSILAYSVIPGTTDRTSFPRAWTLEGSTNGGTTYASSSEYGATFRRSGDAIIAPATNTGLFGLYRLNITTNGGNVNVTRVGDLSLYRFVPVSAPVEWRRMNVPDITTWTGVACSDDGESIFVCSYGLGIYRSISNLDNWQLVTGSANFTNFWQAIASSGSGGRVYAVKDTSIDGIGKIMRSNNSGSSFTDLGAADFFWDDVAASSDDNFATVAAVTYEFAGRPIYVSTNAGSTWTTSSVSRRWSGIDMSADGSRMAAVNDDQSNSVFVGRVWLSTNSGAAWAQSTAPQLGWSDISMSGDGKTLFACTRNTNSSAGTIYFSTNAGSTWIQADVANVAYTAIDCSHDGKVALAVGNGSECAITQDGGKTWAMLSMPNNLWQDVALSASGDRIIAVGYHGVYVRDLEFLPPSIVDEPGITILYPSQARVYTSINPNGLPSTAWIALGTDPDFDTTNTFAAGSGTTLASFSSVFSNLFPNTTYYYRTFATNKTGEVRFGNVLRLTTPPAGTAGLNLDFNGTQFSGTVTGSLQTIYYVQTTPSLLPENWKNIATNHTGESGMFLLNVAPGDETNLFIRAISR